MPRSIPTLRLTMALAREIPAPESGFCEVQDEEVPHLRLRVASTGRRSWHYLAWQRGAPRRRAIGAVDAVSVALARDTARHLDLEWSTAAAAVLTRLRGPRRVVRLGEVWAEYMQSCAGRLRPRSLYEKRSLWGLYLQPWSELPLDQITRAKVAALHEQIGRSGHAVTANRVVKTLRALWSWAEDLEMVRGRNPAARIPQFPEVTRDRFLRQDEAARLLTALRSPQTPARLRHLVLLCLATGQRRGNVLAMRWADLDLAAGSWTIPAAAAKGRRTLQVPLLPLALQALAERRAEVGASSPWVFPGRDKEDQPWREPKKAWAGLLARAGISGLHLHDLRRTLGSWMAIGNASTAIIGRALGHASPASTAIYARLTSDPVAAAMQGALDAMGAVPSADSAE